MGDDPGIRFLTGAARDASNWFEKVSFKKEKRLPIEKPLLSFRTGRNN